MNTRKLIAPLALVALAVPGSAAATESHTFTAPVPCHFTCAYWTDPIDGQEAACRTPPLTLPASFDDWNLTIPSAYTRLHFELRPWFDYDSFLCYAPPNPGPDGRFFIESESPYKGTCPNLAIFGCPDEIDYCISATDDTCVAPGARVIFRVYNWLDPETSIVGTLEYLE